ncbi:sigma factor-like helix-turn-helix DNA-binding protein [Paenibacillus macquariensis]|uniref:sigma factor-like helix-turn-helix DNA-binding protein n=1 Tax=Paenibacillus macquariensis TaxID=948756 RepID=UPI00313E556A
MQYRAKIIKKRECSFYGIESTVPNFTYSTENKILVQQLINTLPPYGKIILYKLYIQDQTESEVARQLQMSQQAVNKWKRKMIQQLSQTANS